MQRSKLVKGHWKDIQRWRRLENMEGNKYTRPAVHEFTQKDPSLQISSEVVQEMQPCVEVSRGQPMEGSSLQETAPSQTLQFIKAELVKTQKSIKDLQSERRLLRKQLSRWTGAVQELQESQEVNRFRLQAQIQALAESSQCLRTELQQLRHNVQEVPHNSNIKQGFEVKTTHVSEPSQWGNNGFSHKEISVFRDQKVWQDLKSKSQRENDSLRAQNWKTLTHMRQLCQSINASTNPQTPANTEHGGYPRTSRPEKCSVPLQNNLDSLKAQSEESPSKEEVELQELVVKLKDALSLHILPGHIPSQKQELFNAAGQVCRLYSDLINKTIETITK